MFDIYLTKEVVPESGGRAVYGKIILGAHLETFVASLVCWTPEDYRTHWLEACHRIVAGESLSALIASYVAEPMSEFLVWWPLYRDAHIVHVQNEILEYGQLPTPFAIANPWAAIRPRATRNEDGMEISEWDICDHDLQVFLDRYE